MHTTLSISDNVIRPDPYEPETATRHPQMTWFTKVLVIPVGIIQLLYFIEIARHRLIDGDEGFYLLASRLVFQHKLPYRDFFYPQMPLLPYVYGLYLSVAGLSWMTARTLAAILTSALGVLLYLKVSTETRKWYAGLASVLLFVTATQIFAWLPIAKTYSLSSLLLFGAYSVVSRASAGLRTRSVIISGLLLGLGTDTRLYFAGVLPVFFYWIFRNQNIRIRGKALLLFMAGFVAAVIPNLYFLVISPKAYVFNNLIYHLNRRADLGLLASWGQKLRTAMLVFLFGPGGLQLGILVAISILLVIKGAGGPRAGWLALQLAVILGCICLIPTPSHEQYFCVAMPFLITAVACLATDAAEGLGSATQGPWARWGVPTVLLIFVCISLPGYRRYLATGESVPGVRNASDWTMAEVTRVSAAIDELARPDEPVMSLWPGYMFQSTAAEFGGLENHAGLAFSPSLLPGELSAYHIISENQIRASLAHGTPRIVVIGNQDSMIVDGTPYMRMAEQFGYLPARVMGGTAIYVRPGRP